MPEQGTPDLTQATRTLETALADFQAAFKASGVLQATSGPVFRALRQWRTEQARAKAVPPYVIATDAALHAIEAAKPQDLAALGAVRGVGPTKAATYGAEILKVVATAA